ncbi:MAG: cell division protein ZapA [Vulcanibacillus sp.]
MNEDRKSSLSVIIQGQEYKIIDDKGHNYLRTVAAHVDDIMNKISQAYPQLDSKKIAVLTAINISDEYFQLKHEYDELLKLFEEK